MSRPKRVARSCSSVLGGPLTPRGRWSFARGRRCTLATARLAGSPTLPLWVVEPSMKESYR